MTTITKKILKVLYPVRCPFCEKAGEEQPCRSCREEITYICEPRCKCCGKPVRYLEQEHCRDCLAEERFFDSGRSLWLHQDKVSRALYRFKYKRRICDGEFYGNKLAEQFEQQIRRWRIDQIIPVPLHRRKYRQRGFNQAETIAGVLGEKLRIPVNSRAVCRKRNTVAQKQLNNKERSKNLANAFSVDERQQVGSRILLIDDIYTTGSTINEVAKTLKKSGVQKVYFLTISIGQGL